ncbi:hypothetical protein [Polaribacter porphyrae]|uniref:Uncharacterized protein n=1 Tax=Polaribacter porphyrae TaxID=1137780 RepID=A0A2S7WJN7_9FLAO|nr:hypothetical protein [Polaribacter porphyrae]PQJ77819.1 hypothetical protein BTO18_00855 [Polaribacter porphyrae]
MKNNTQYMFGFGVLVLFIIMLIISTKKGIKMDSAQFWVYRIATALATASISISIPGMIKISYTPKGDEINTHKDNENNTIFMTLAEKEPTITSSGAIAVFVLVYLFNPIN